MLRKLTADERAQLWARTRPGAHHAQGPWTRVEISMLKSGHVTHGLSDKALWSWCQTHEVKRHPDAIEAKLVELNHFVPLTPYERARDALRKEVEAARAEAPSAPLYRPSIREIDAFIHGVSVKTQAGRRA